MRRAPSLPPSLFLGLVLLLAAPEYASVFAISSSGPLYIQSTDTLIGKVLNQTTERMVTTIAKIPSYRTFNHLNIGQSGRVVGSATFFENH